MNFYKILKIKKLGRGSPDFWTRLFAKHTGGGSVKPIIVELTGRLPLTFSTSDTKLHDWTIRGNNEPGEWNTPQVYTEWEQGTRVPTTQGGETYDQIKENAGRRVRSVNLIPVVTPFYYEINSGYQIGATFFDENGLSLGSSSNVEFRSAPYTYTGEGKYVSFAIKSDANTAITPSSDFEVKIASPYYQLGVGEKTKNFARAIVGTTSAGITFTVDSVAGTVTANGTATGTAQIRIAINNPNEPNNTTVPPGNYYYSGCPSGGSGSTYNCYSWDTDIGARSKRWDGTTNVETDLGQGNCQVQINGHRQSILLRIAEGYTANNLVFKPMLRPANTTSEFIPYGYQIPLITMDAKTAEYVYRTNIFIGDSPLTEGESVSKSSTGLDVKTIAIGVDDYPNKLITSLSNVPEMTIKYKTKGGS